MGSHQNVNPVIGIFPRQSDWVGRRVQVTFDYLQSSETIRGTIVRCDAEEPGRLIIRLDTGQFVLSTECQYSFLPQAVGGEHGR